MTVVANKRYIKNTTKSSEEFLLSSTFIYKIIHYIYYLEKVFHVRV